MKRLFTLACALAFLISVAAAAQGPIRVLVLTGNVTQEEYPVLSQFQTIGSFQFEWAQTADRSLPGLENYDILWIGQGEICENAYFFDAATETKIKDFVANGGIVISIGQDSDDGRPCEDGWLPVDLIGVERGGTEVFEVTNAPEVGSLFEKPNQVNTAHFDDAWTAPPPEIILLATINNGQDVGIGLLPHGDGYYIVTSLENESASDVQTNQLIIENLLLYAAELLASASTPVEPLGKAAVLWGAVKANHR
ncbi:MAG: hypothetical protein KatS3mg115_1289 [Candidatus Poribacteria bacterium]|nr:MAG: hypothetical protein KatS3mg115_1289 [Candidatus Poribacteria bacterium]